MCILSRYFNAERDAPGSLSLSSARYLFLAVGRPLSLSFLFIVILLW